MIHKVERLISIGKFRNYQASGDVSFRKLTLIYAENGAGKTTLAAVMRSLTQNKPGIIQKRISTNSTAPQAAQIIQRDQAGKDTYYTFRPSGWSSPFPDLEIFDIHFINENIYSGFDFNDEQKRQLHIFVVGAQGVAIKQQIEQNKAAKTASRLRINNIETDIIQQVGNGLDSGLIATFVAIPVQQSEKNDDKIRVAEVALQNARANVIIQTLQTLSTIGIMNLSIDLDAIIRDLGITTDTIQNITLKELFNNHCEELSCELQGPETWLQIGYRYLVSKRNSENDEMLVSLACPFCKQPVSETLDIIKAYALRFNEAFNDFAQRIQAHLNALNNFNLASIIHSINNVQQNNTDRVNSWLAHLPVNSQPNVNNLIMNEAVLGNQLQALIATVQIKVQNPSIVVATDVATTFKTSIENISSSISAYNQSVVSFNNVISLFRAGIQTEQRALEELNRLLRIKKRFDPVINALCTSLVAEKQNLRLLDQSYSQLTQQEQTAVLLFFSSYKDRINYYLGQVFKTPFRIDDVVHVPPQGRATQSKIGYKLTIDALDISFDASQPNSTKDCLSEGDKSTIALAFFLAKIDIDPGKANKVLIFDDPLSSFDSNRRLYTAQLIKDLYPLLRQIIVLSHNEFFLYEVSKGVSGGEIKTLRIAENFATRAARIEPLNLGALVEIEYFKHIKELEEFLQNPDISKKDTVLGHMRNILEAHIGFKFYRQISSIPENSRTFGKLIDELVNKNVQFRNDTNPPSIITKMRLINAISCKPHHGEPIPDYRVLGVDPNTIAIVELANFINDTLDLIDNRL
jgi:wobble nucleotide-excising tRNase